MKKETDAGISGALRRFWDLLAGEVSGNTIERFIRDEIPGAYSLFRKNLRDEQLPAGRVRRFLRVVWYLFLVFLEKLTPIRRLLFALAVIFFVLGVGDPASSNLIWSFLMVNLVLILEVADKLVTKNELVIAREIQLSLLPSDLRVPPGFEVVAHTEVANSVGGDYYDTIPVKGGGVIYAVADVSGKGISAALYTTTVQTALRLFAEGSDDPAVLVRRVGEYMQDRLKRGYFLTLALMHVTPAGNVRLARAGHPRSILVTAKDGGAELVPTEGPAIGLGNLGDNDVQVSLRKRLRNVKRRMEAGDLLVCVSDGVLEASRNDGEEYGEHRLTALLQAFRQESPEKLKDILLADLREFRSGHELRDDVTFLILKRVDRTS